ncbi:MAG: hypothetical protein AAF399_28915 [Bacteroidota bacterium]
MAIQEHWLEYEEAWQLLQAEELPPSDRIRLSPKKHKLVGESLEGVEHWELRLPLPMPQLGEEETLESYVQRLPDTPPAYLLMLIQMGAASLGYFEDGEVVVHKAFKKYMKRHKRGKAQISYLNTRGKSKAGSRIRLANTVRFAEEINERLTEWEEWYEPERIIYSCSAQLWGLLFQSKVPPPFEKKDPRLIKVPMDVKIPTHEELLRVNEFLLKGRLTLSGE